MGKTWGIILVGNLYCQWELSPGSGNALCILFPTIVSLDLSKVTITLQDIELDSSFGIQQVTSKDKGLAGEVSASTKKKGRTMAITAEDMQKRKNDVMARTTLLLALPNEHQLRVSKYDTAKELWEAILKTFDGNEATKKTKKNQLKQQYGNFKAEGSETLEQTFNRDDLDTMSLDDVYNYLKVYKPEVQKRAGSNIQNMAFIYSSNTSSEKSEVPTVQGVSTASAQVSTDSTDVAAANLSYDTVCAFIATQPNGSYMVEEDEALKNHSFVTNEKEEPTEYALMAKSRSSSDNEKDLSWMGLPEFVDDTVTDYTRPTSSIDVSESGIPQDNIDDKGYWYNACSRNMTGNISYLSEYEPFNGGYVSFGHEKGKITGKGSIKTGKLEFENVYFVEELKYNESMLWHRRLGHLNFKTMNKLVRSNLVKGLPSKSFKNNHSCVACLKGKQHKASCKSNLVNSISKPLYTLHMDLFGPTSVSSLNHKWILRNFITEIENLKDLNVKIIRSDNRGEFRNKEMDEFCSRKGIKREFSNARTPQQNGVAKRRNRTLIEVVRTMLVDAKLHVAFWAKAVNTACYVKIRVLVIKPHNKTPYELFNERSLAIGFLRPFGCHVMILNTLDHLGKFDAKGDEGYFVGYTLSSKAFRVFNKRTKKIKENLHMDFLENKPLKRELEQEEVNGDKEVLESSGNLIHTASIKVSTNDSFALASSLTMETKVPTVSTHVPTGSLYVPSLQDLFGDTSEAVSLNDVKADLSNMETDIQVSPTPTLKIHKDHPKSQITKPIDTLVQTRQKTKNVDEQSFITIIHQKTNLDLLQYCLLSCFLSQEEPKKKVDALKDPRWVESMQQELLQFKIQNEEGIDYKEVCVPVARIEAIRLFLAYASYMGFTIYQMDVKSAFLYRTIDEEVYVMQPPGFQDPEFPHRVYKVEKAIHQVTPKECHLHVVKRIFRYLKGHRKLGLWYPKVCPFDLVAYSDSDYSGANQDRKSTIGGYDNVADVLTKAFDVGRFQYLVGGDLGNSVNGLNRDPVSKVPSPGADETVFLTGDARYGEAFHTVTSLDAGQVRENNAKTSDMPHKASPTVTSLGGGESKERRICSGGCSKHGGMDQGEDLLVRDTVKDSDKSADKGSDNTDDMANVLGTLGAANILASGGLSGSFPTTVIFTTASVATPTIRVTRSSRGVVIESSSLIFVNIPSISKKDKGKWKMIEPEQPSKEKVLEQMSAQLARDLEAKFSQEDQIIREQSERDYEIAMIHAERELEMMIAELDRSNEIVAKYLSEYEQAKVGLSHDEKVELIDELLMYQRNHAQIKKYQDPQNKPSTKTERRDFYMSILRSNVGWKSKDFKGMTFE
nr:putative ribonuclease H-like domain-containing protein [Tanacetum cinerariifolium]